MEEEIGVHEQLATDATSKTWLWERGVGVSP